jgi:hypothetical protein
MKTTGMSYLYRFLNGIRLGCSIRSNLHLGPGMVVFMLLF